MESKTVIYYTSNAEKPEFEAKIIECLKKNSGGLPIISVSRFPIDLGVNVCVGEKPICYSNSLRQILIGLKMAKTEFCIAAESDVLYPPEYFTFTPSEKDKVYRYDNLFVQFDGRNSFWRKKSVEGAQMCGREYWIKCLEDMIENDSWEQQNYNPALVFPEHSVRYYSGPNPVLYFKTRQGIGFKTGFIPGSVKEIPYWGTLENVKKNYL